MPLTDREIEALDICRAHLDKIEPNAEYVGEGKFAVEPKDNPSRGKCYLASAALAQFLGGVKEGYHLAKATNHLGDHYWVVNDYGVILDPTKEQFDLIGEKPPYKLGHKVGRRNTLTKHLPLLEAMQLNLGNTVSKAARDLFGRPLVVEKSAVLTDTQQEMLTEAWRALITDWAERPEEFIRSAFSKGALAVHFVRALLYGEDIPRTATMAYTWERFYVAGSGRNEFNELFSDAVDRPNLIKGIRYVLGEEASFSKLISANLPVFGYRIPADFPIGLARELINRYCPVNGVVLDPCHGWGGRMVGFMLSRAGSYVGIDPAPHSYKLQEMFDDLSHYLLESKKLRLINKPFEDVVLRSGGYDFALTSPPYFNIERYEGEQTSWRRYSTLKDWVDGFYRPMLEGVSDALKPGAYFALQVTPKFNMVDVAKKVGKEIGLEYQRVFDTNMKRYNSISADKSGSTDSFEVVAIFQRQ